MEVVVWRSSVSAASRCTVFFRFGDMQDQGASTLPVKYDLLE